MKTRITNSMIYPLYPSKTWLEKAMLRLNFGGIVRCQVCGRITLITGVEENLRDSCRCVRCEATNRHRQVAYVACGSISSLTNREISSLPDFSMLEEFVVYNTEAKGPIHNNLSGMKNYLCSEYFEDGKLSGEFVKGVMHQDLRSLSFDDDSIDLMISCDVFEHIPEPYVAHKEVYRVLKRGGRHIFTVPFYQTEFLDDVRTGYDEQGNTLFLKDPIYHLDPIRPEGILVHTIFSLEMLIELKKIGFRTHFYVLYKPLLGIVGPNGLVFEVIKE